MAEQLRLFELETQEVILNLLDRPRTLEEFESNSYSLYSNSSLADFIQANLVEESKYKVKPLPEQLVAGKNTYVYDAHTYHTKVPPQAIARLIEFITKEAYTTLTEIFSGVSDEHRMQLFVQYLSQ